MFDFLDTQKNYKKNMNLSQNDKIKIEKMIENLKKDCEHLDFEKLNEKLKTKNNNEKIKILEDVINQCKKLKSVITDSEIKIDGFNQILTKLSPKVKFTTEMKIFYYFEYFKDKTYPWGALESENLHHLYLNIKNGRFDEEIDREKVLNIIDKEYKYSPKPKDVKNYEEYYDWTKYNGYDLYNYLNNELAKINSEEEINKLSEDIKRLETQKISLSSKSSFYRKLGEIYNVYGNIPLTLKYYELALKINPRVGIKREYEKLKKADEK